MQLYTKILIGMLVGVLDGLGFGPNAALLDHDMYYYGKASNAQLYLKVDQVDPAIELGGGELKLKIIKHREGVLHDALGKEILNDEGAKERGNAWALVSFKVTAQQLLGARGEKLKARLKSHLKRDKIKVGEQVQAWLKISYTQIKADPDHPEQKSKVIPRQAPVSSWGQWLLSLLAPLGAVFMRLLKMVIVPLVFSSLLVGVASLGDVRKLGRLGSRTIGLYIMTTAVAVGIGLLCANLISPGSFIDPEAKARLLSEFQGLHQDF